MRGACVEGWRTYLGHARPLRTHNGIGQRQLFVHHLLVRRSPTVRSSGREQASGGSRLTQEVSWDRTVDLRFVDVF
jgi:hypothetical protein